MVRKLVETVKELGVFNTLLYSINQAFKYLHTGQVIFHYVLFAQPVRNKALLPERRGKSIQVRQIYNNNPYLTELPPPKHILSERFSQGAQCLAAFQNEELLGCIWLCLAQYHEDEVRVIYHPHPENETSWDFDVYIKPKHRAGLAFAKLWDEANKFLHERKINWTFSRISAFNVVSLTSHKRLGATPVGNAIFIKIGSWQIMLANTSPYFHLSTNQASKPSLDLYTPNVKN